jgi:hypothetical protein
MDVAALADAAALAVRLYGLQVHLYGLQVCLYGLPSHPCHGHDRG